MPDFSLEEAARRQGHRLVAGVDEAGRGPWAGPVVAGACVLDAAALPGDLLAGLDDSKKLTAARRETLFAGLARAAVTGVGIASVAEIDRLNILQATFLAMQRAVADLGVVPDHVLVDGTKIPELVCSADAIKKGDGLSLSIAAASIVAKVSRDRIMADLGRGFPEYGWARNAGYGTAEHRAALRAHGVTGHHRRTFKPIRALIAGGA